MRRNLLAMSSCVVGVAMSAGTGMAQKPVEGGGGPACGTDEAAGGGMGV